MNREWKPGDVALVKNEWNVWNVAICTLRSDRHGYWWRYGVAESFSPIVADARPLVVIDPEDREQDERLDTLIWNTVDENTAQFDLRAALREFANPQPPKPEEPQGLGAVVEDADGSLLIRTDHETRPWTEAKNGSIWHWEAVDAVRVLSEGVVV